MKEDPQSTWLGDFRLLLAGELAADPEVEQGAKLRVASQWSLEFSYAPYKIADKRTYDICVGRLGRHPRCVASGYDEAAFRFQHRRGCDANPFRLLFVPG